MRITKRSLKFRLLFHFIETCILCFLFLIPRSALIEPYGHAHGDGPADRPCAPDSDGAEDSCQSDGQCHTQDQVGEGGDHEVSHQTSASQDAVGYQLCGDYKIEWGKNPQELDACVDSRAGGVIHEEEYQITSGEEVSQEQRYT